MEGKLAIYIPKTIKRFRKKTMGQNVHVAIQEGNNVKAIKQGTSVLDQKTVKICVPLRKNIKLQVI